MPTHTPAHDMLPTVLLAAVEPTLRSALHTLHDRARILGEGHSGQEVSAIGEELDDLGRFLARTFTELMETSGGMVVGLLPRAEVDVPAVVNEVLDVFGRVPCRVREPRPVRAVTHEPVLRYLIGALVDEAASHAPAGYGVRVGVDQPGPRQVRISIRTLDLGGGLQHDNVAGLPTDRIPGMGLLARAAGIEYLSDDTAMATHLRLATRPHPSFLSPGTGEPARSNVVPMSPR